MNYAIHIIIVMLRLIASTYIFTLFSLGTLEDFNDINSCCFLSVNDCTTVFETVSRQGTKCQTGWSSSLCNVRKCKSCLKAVQWISLISTTNRSFCLINNILAERRRIASPSSFVHAWDWHHPKTEVLDFSEILVNSWIGTFSCRSQWLKPFMVFEFLHFFSGFILSHRKLYSAFLPCDSSLVAILLQQVQL